MNSNSKVIAFLVLTVLVIGFGIWLTKTGSTQKQPGFEASAKGGDSQPAGPGNRPGQPNVAPLPTSDLTSTQASTVVPNQAASAPTSAAVDIPGNTANTNLILDWEERIDDLLASQIEDREAAKQMIAMIPRLPEEGKVDAVQHISNLLPDSDYPEVAKLMNDTTLSEDVLDELFMDLLNRPTSIMLPELLEIMKRPKHPNAEEAKDFLELYLEDDYGNDWTMWDRKIKEWVTENPD